MELYYQRRDRDFTVKGVRDPSLGEPRIERDGERWSATILCHGASVRVDETGRLTIGGNEPP